MYCHSKVFDNDFFGYYKVTVERPLLNENGEPIVKRTGRKEPDADLRDFEMIPLQENICEYFKREVLPYAPDAWIDEKKTIIGYEIPMTRCFYEYQQPESVRSILRNLTTLETEIRTVLDSFWADIGEEEEFWKER